MDVCLGDDDDDDDDDGFWLAFEVLQEQPAY